MHILRFLKTGSLVLSMALSLWATDYDVQKFGVKGDGVTVNTASIQYAIDYISDHGGGRLVFTAGTYRTGSIYLKSGVILHLERAATLMSTTNPFDFVKDEDINWMSMIFAKYQKDIGITGEGGIDGRGFETANNMLNYIQRGLFDDKLLWDRPREPNRPQNIYFRECENITITGITIKDPASWNQTYDQCVNILVDGITVDSKSYWNNDGIDIVDCDGVVIKNSYFDAADDVICFKSHDPDKICQNIVVDNCVGRSSANGLKFGTVSRGGFRNVKVTNLTIFDTYRSAITFAAVDGGIVENIVVDGVRSINTGNVIYLRIGDRWSKGKEPVMKDITIRNVYAEVPLGKPDAGYGYEGPIEDLPRNISPSSIVGLPNHRIENVTLENIEIVYPGGSDPFYAKVGLTPEELDNIPEMPAKYPEFSQFKELPAWGFYLRHADGITFKNVTLRAKNKDYRPAIVMDDVKGALFKDMEIEEPESEQNSKEQIFQYQSENIRID
ncbi:glycoside hydrolase family 28 protein [Membranicola marinus]|uniref:Glycoside hydrolase family 28 protein n=1 Tax=Membranihabitans marinus TaxID=1227546 RepID=A0A953HWN0_9BACT|nr:glycosyl hydrolase family 28 protein [Membranihabitans marinus]MBY5959526.1 glycoside hydrolase family 28 protein [Membranihabitans marinus]